MFNTDNLTTSAKYSIAGENGEWTYTGFENNRYIFKRFSDRVKTLKLSKSQTCMRCWEQVSTPININRLEAFRGL
jgi:hypothetical protein